MKGILKNEVINLLSSDTFYSMDNIILNKYAHIKTPQHILDSLQKFKIDEEYIDWIENKIIGTKSIVFAWDSLKYANIRGNRAIYVPLVYHRATFRRLNDAQKEWYFYWRQRVLNGEYPDTDLDYILLFAHELINYTFNDNAAFNVSMMERLYESYREREPELENYLPIWIHDFLIELGEEKLADDWCISYEPREDPSYKRIVKNQDRLDKICITAWKRYLKLYKETEFFRNNKSKIYYTFRQGIVLLNDIYKLQGISLLENWFEKENIIRNGILFTTAVSAAIVGRSLNTTDRKYVIHHPSKKIFDEITAIFQMSENVIRFIMGEERYVEVQSEQLPDNFREMLFKKLYSKKLKDRFILVQEGRKGKEIISIPPPPKEKNHGNVITFNMEEIERLNRQSEELRNNFREMGYEDEKAGQDSFKEEAVDKVIIVEEIGEKSINTFEFDFGSDAKEDDFIETLTDMECKYLGSFEDLKKGVRESNAFIKSIGIMSGTFISSINEKANAYLDDNLIEIHGDYYVIYEDYENIITKIKKGEVNEH